MEPFYAVFESLKTGRMPAPDVLAVVASKVLGYCIVGAGSIVKVPQIMKVVKNRSAEGLSFSSIELEVLGYFVAMAYNMHLGLSFSASGEVPLILLQDWILLALVYWYAKASAARVIAIFCLFGGLVYSHFSGMVTPEILEAAFLANNFIFAAARIPQIWQNFREGSTGELSLVTNAANLLGCLVRILTSVMESAGWPVLRSFLIGTTLNTILVGQIVYYGWGGKGAAAKGKKKRAKKTQ